MRSDPPNDRWRTPSSIRKRKIDFSRDTNSGSERGDKYNSCIGGIQKHMYNFVYYGYELRFCNTIYMYILYLNQGSHF